MTFKRSISVMAGIVAVTAATVVVSVSCESMSPEDRQAYVDQSRRVEASAEAERERQAAELSRAIAAGDAGAVKKANEAIAVLDKILKLVRDGKATFEASVGPDGTIDISPAATAIGGAVGGVAGTGIAVGLPLLWSLISRARNAKTAGVRLKDFETVLRNIDRVSIAEPAVNATLNAAWPEIEKGLSKEAIATINRVSVT